MRKSQRRDFQAQFETKPRWIFSVCQQWQRNWAQPLSEKLRRFWRSVKRGFWGCVFGGRTSDAKATSFCQKMLVFGIVRTVTTKRERVRMWERREKEEEDGEGGVR